MKATAALSRFDFSPQNYFYPPPYSMLGALTFGLAPNHPFLLMDCLGFLLFAHYFIALASRHTGWMTAQCGAKNVLPLPVWRVTRITNPPNPSVILLAISWLPAAPMIGVPVEPYQLYRRAGICVSVLAYRSNVYRQPAPGIRTTAFMGLLGGFVFATRPVDAVVLIPAFVFLIWHLLRPSQQTQLHDQHQRSK